MTAPAPGLEDVARATGYSVGTVSRALAGKGREGRISEKAVEAIRRAADRIGFSRNEVAAALRTRTTRTIGLVVSDIANPFFGRIASLAERAAPEHGILVSNSGEDRERERDCLEALAARRVSGVLLSPVGRDPEVAARLERQKIPVVTFDREYPARRFDAVVCNNRDTAARLTAKLAERCGGGAARLGFVGGSRASTTHAERFAGFRDAAGGRSVFEVDAEAAARRMLDREGIVFANSLLAEGAIAWLLEHEPERLAAMRLASFDESPLFAAVPVLVARQPEERIVGRAIDLLLARMAGRGGARKRIVLRQAIVAPRK